MPARARARPSSRPRRSASGGTTRATGSSTATDLTEGVEIPRDPIDLLRRVVPAELADELDERARAEVERAYEAALAAPRPEPDLILEDVWT